MRFSTAAVALASAVAALNFDEGHNIALKGWQIPGISNTWGPANIITFGLDLNVDLGVFYKLPFNMIWGKEF